MKHIKGKFIQQNLMVILCTLAVTFQVSGQNLTSKLDDFNRANNVTLGIPSSGGAMLWQEQETAGSNDYRVRIENNQLVLGSLNNAGTGAA